MCQKLRITWDVCRRRRADAGESGRQEVISAKDRLEIGQKVSEVNAKLNCVFGGLGGRPKFGLGRGRITGARIQQRRDRLPNLRVESGNGEQAAYVSGSAAAGLSAAPKAKRVLGIDDLVAALQRHPRYAFSTELYDILQTATMVQT
jgi:hypothetical protein